MPSFSFPWDNSLLKTIYSKKQSTQTLPTLIITFAKHYDVLSSAVRMIILFYIWGTFPPQGLQAVKKVSLTFQMQT